MKNTPPNALHERIKQRIRELGITDEAASLRVGTDRSYFRKLFDRPNSHPRADTLLRIAIALETDQAWLLGGSTDMGQPDFVAQRPDGSLIAVQAKRFAGDASSSNVAPPPSRAEMPLDVPVMGTAAGSHIGGAFKLEGGIVDYVRRPPALVGAKEIYGLYVEGTSMEPQYFPGDLIYVHPHRPARLGDIVVVQCRNGEHAIDEASLGIYRKKTERSLVIGKRNPVADIEIPRERVVAIHRVLTTNELFGV